MVLLQQQTHCRFEVDQFNLSFVVIEQSCPAVASLANDVGCVERRGDSIA